MEEEVKIGKRERIRRSRRKWNGKRGRRECVRGRKRRSRRMGRGRRRRANL